MPVNGKKETVGLYFHIPFCTKKCPYCHFFVLPDDERLKAQFLQALDKEWELRLPLLENKEIVSIYFGGGTPSLLPPVALAHILKKIPRSSDCEITIEANPENLSPSLLADFAALGINRLSLGVQSLEEASLTILGRTHNASKALAAIESAAYAGFTNITIDLMYDLPEQTVDSWQRTLARLKDLPITHLSLYNLTFEPTSLFFKKKKSLLPLVPAPEQSLEMLECAIATCESIGLKRYEISAFAREGFQARHNSGYWTGRPFLGFGPSAFSYWNKKRFRNVAHLKKYAEALEQGLFPVDFEEELPFPSNLAELLAIHLRLLAGVDLAQFQKEHAPLPSALWSAIAHLCTKGWLQQKDTRLQLTPEGLLFYDSVGEELIY